MRRSTKTTDLAEAKATAEELYEELRFKQRNRHPLKSKTFKQVAGDYLRKAERDTVEGHLSKGRLGLVEGTLRRFLVPLFGVQLKAKQKLKGYYGNIGERKFQRYYRDAVRGRGDTGENLIALLERRLDAAVYRAKFVPTVFAARQFVNHGHVTVNGRRVTIPSYQLRDEDVIEVKQASRELPLVL